MKILIAILMLFLAVPLQGAWWYVCKKPGMEVIGKIWVSPGSHVEVLVPTTVMCLKLDEAPEPIPVDLKQAITVKENQVIEDGKTVNVVTVSISKERIAQGFEEQQYVFDLTEKEFKVKEVQIIDK